MKYYASLAGLLLTSTLHATTWHSEIAPYLWASGLKGSVQIGTHQVAVDETFFDLLKELKFGAMVWASTYGDNFGVFFNGLYSKVSDTQTIKDLNITSTSQMTIVAAGISHRFYFMPSNAHYLEPYAGARYTNNTTELTINAFNVKQTEIWTDAIAGARLNFSITPHFNIEGAADYGHGEHSSSYNWSLVAGYQSPNHFKNTRFYLGYRLLHQNYSHGQDARYYQWKMNIAGPVLGMSFKF